MGLTCPRVTAVSERLIPPRRPGALGRAAPSTLRRSGPARTVPSCRGWRSRPALREAGADTPARRNLSRPTGRRQRLSPATVTSAAAGRPAPDAGSRARTRPPGRRSSRQCQGWPRHATAAGRGLEASASVGPTLAAAPAHRAAARRRPRQVRSSPRHNANAVPRCPPCARSARPRRPGRRGPGARQHERRRDDLAEPFAPGRAVVDYGVPEVRLRGPQGAAFTMIRCSQVVTAESPSTPAAPSVCSRRMSACPTCLAVSSIMWT